MYVTSFSSIPYCRKNFGKSGSWLDLCFQGNYQITITQVEAKIEQDIMKLCKYETTIYV